MLGCNIGEIFKVAVAGGSYQEGLITHIQGVPPDMAIAEEEIYRELLLRKPGQGELSSPRREGDIPILYAGVNAADTMPGFQNKGLTNGTPLVILIPNLDRHFEHIDQYQRTNRTPRPGHASLASFIKYGSSDDAIGAGIFSGRYTSTICAAGAVAKKILAMHGIEVIGYVKEAAGVRMPEMPLDQIKPKVAAYRKVRAAHDPIYNNVFANGRLRPDMRLFEKMAVLAEVEKEIPDMPKPKFNEEAIRKEYGIHPKLNCPHLETADAMYKEIIRITEEGDSTGGQVEIVATGVPAGLGEPVFRKLDGEIGRMMSIAAVRAVEVGIGVGAKDVTGAQCNDQIRSKDGKIYYESNNAGGLAGGITTGQDIVCRLTVKPTPTIAKPQRTIDKVTKENADLAAVTRRDPTIVPRVWPVGEAFLAILLVDHLMAHFAYRGLWGKLADTTKA